MSTFVLGEKKEKKNKLCHFWETGVLRRHKVLARLRSGALTVEQIASHFPLSAVALLFSAAFKKESGSCRVMHQTVWCVTCYIQIMCAGGFHNARSCVIINHASKYSGGPFSKDTWKGKEQRRFKATAMPALDWWNKIKIQTALFVRDVSLLAPWVRSGSHPSLRSEDAPRFVS